MLSLAVSFATWQADHEVLYRENAGLRSQVAKLEVGGSWGDSCPVFEREVQSELGKFDMTLSAESIRHTRDNSNSP